jgi:tetratricopeptide (TPR) repeat protein
MVLVAFCALVAGDHPQAQELDSQAEILYQDALNAQAAENWDQAIGTLKRGIEVFPKDYRFPRTLGQLFASRKLYGLAWEAYGIAENLAPDDPELLYELSQVAGRLNKDLLSLGYLQKIIELQPENKDAISDLGWMYFKLHRLSEGETLLLAALSALGPDRGFSMTLGTIYADMFRYKEAKQRYHEALLEAEASGAMLFTAVAHYNMSILESRFYQFEEAFKRTEASLAAADRTSGHLAKGELFLRRLDIPKTIDQYLQAYELDNSPLSKINLAQAYQIAGRLQDGKNLLEDVLHLQDYSWMVHYGTDPNSHKRDLHDILQKTYNGLSNIELRSSYFGFIEMVEGLYKHYLYRIIGMWHEYLYAMYSLKVADTYAAANQDLDAALNYYDAFQKHPRRAAFYLESAQNLETKVIPQAYPNYQVEVGIVLGQTEPLEWALQQLDPLWERDVSADAYIELAQLYKRKNDDLKATDCIEHAYALNKGSIRQAGIIMPMDIEIGQSFREDTIRIKKITKVLRTIGLAPVSIEQHEKSHRYRLNLFASGQDADLELRDTLKGTILFKTTITLGDWSAEEHQSLVDQLETLFFVNQ